MSITAVLFDLDGTLLNTLEDLVDATNYALAQFGHPPRTLMEVRRFIGNGAENQIRLSLPDDNKEDLQQVLALYKPYYTAHCQIKTRPYEGVLTALNILREKYPIAIVSNKPDSAVKALCADYFPGIYALGETAGCPRKPAADMVFKAMQDIGVDRCVYVGDSEVDVLTASRAGVPCIAVSWGFRDREDLVDGGAQYICDDPVTLPKMIETIVGEIHGK